MKIFNPKVSIVIPVYNGSNYLKEAIDSALAQTYKNIEIIVVNDGSNDNGATEQIAKSYGDKIRYYGKENGGVATAINVGIQKMTGEYFSWLSHDDFYYQDKIEKQINFLSDRDDKKVFLYSNYAILRGTEITPVIHNHEMLLRKSKYSLLRGCVNGITVLIPKTVLDEMGEFDAELRCVQDYDYWRRIEAKYEFIHMEDVLSITRLHPGQDTNVSPRVILESDALWTDMIKKLPDAEKIRYEGTLYNFYFEMVKFLETTPYAGVLKYSKEKLAKLEQELKEERFNPKVSVIIPFYNRVGQTLKALESVQQQDYKNIEIILIDDGSTDDVGKISNYAKKHTNTSVITQRVNAGPAAARNLGIKSATGEYIAFLDSDDEFLPGKLHTQLDAMAKYNRDISYTSYIQRDGEREVIKSEPELTGIVVPLIINNCIIATPTVIVSRKLLDEHKLRFDEKLRIGEDTCFWLEAAKYTQILLVDEPLTVVNVGESTHAQNTSKLVVGVKNLITYLLNDEYYAIYDHNIAMLCSYFVAINNEIREEESHRILYEGPVAHKVIISKKARLTAHVRRSIPYRASRKLYRTVRPRKTVPKQKIGR